MSDQSFDTLKKDFLFEISFVTNIGSQVFVYPFVGKPKSTVCFYFTTFILIVTTILQLTASLILDNLQNWFEIINIAPNLGVCILISLKYIKMYTNFDIYNKVLDHFTNDLWDSIDSKCEKHKIILERYTKVSKSIIRFQYYYTLILIAIVILFPRLIIFYDSEIKGNEIQYLYPFDGWYPFDKVEWYYAAYVWESIMTTIVIFIFAFANMIHISFTRYICMELKILGITMEGLISDADVKNMRNPTMAESIHSGIKQKLKRIIKRHQVLARLVSNLEGVLGAGMLLIYGFGSVFICLTIFTATVVDNLYLCLRYFSFFFSLVIEVFIQCIIGQLLIDHSAKLEQAIYFADWPHADKDTRKVLLIFLIRAQKPFIYSAKGYLVMNLDTFCSVCNLSYQFFNLLRTAYK